MRTEVSSFELDPSYDPERLTGGDDRSEGAGTARNIPILHINIPSYQTSKSVNPFAFNTPAKRSISPIATTIDEFIKRNVGTDNILVRGVQSGHHKQTTRDEFIDMILKNGSDLYEQNSDGQPGDIYAKKFDNTTIEDILTGFHVWKPKCEELPHYPVDIWMIFDSNKFENIEYTHSRHGVKARDKWRPKKHNDYGLKAIFVVN